MKKILLIMSALAITLNLGFGSLALATPTAHAQEEKGALELLKDTGISGQTPEEAGAALPKTIGKLVKAVLGLMGIILVLLMIYAGFMWMTAAGNTEKVEKAKQTITRAVIGAAIMLMAYSITGFVVNAIINAGK